MSSDGRLMPRGKKRKSGDFWAYLTLPWVYTYVGGRRYIVGEVYVCV